MVAGYYKVVDLLDFRLPAIEWGMKWAAENAPKSARHTVVHGDFRHGNLIVGEDGIRLRARLGSRAQRRSDGGSRPGYA